MQSWFHLIVSASDTNWRFLTERCQRKTYKCNLKFVPPDPPPLPALSSSSGQRETDVKVMNEIVSLILFATQIFTFCLILLPFHAIILHMFPLTTCKFPYLIVLFTNWTPLEFKICHVIFHLFLPLRPDKVGPCCYCVAPAVILIYTPELSTNLPVS